MGFSASLKGLCGAENVINERESEEGGSKGCFREKKIVVEMRHKEAMTLWLSKSFKSRSGAAEGNQLWYLGAEVGGSATFLCAFPLTVKCVSQFRWWFCKWQMQFHGPNLTFSTNCNNTMIANKAISLWLSTWYSRRSAIITPIYDCYDSYSNVSTLNSFARWQNMPRHYKDLFISSILQRKTVLIKCDTC